MIYIVTDLQSIPKTCSGDHPTKKYHYECPFWNDEYDCCKVRLNENSSYEDVEDLNELGKTGRPSYCPLRDTNTEGEFR